LRHAASDDGIQGFLQMSIAFGATILEHERADTSAAATRTKPGPVGIIGRAPETVICRRADGSIDYEHYDRIARNLRAHDLRAALGILIAPMHRLLGALWPRTPGSQGWDTMGAHRSSRWSR